MDVSRPDYCVLRPVYCVLRPDYCVLRPDYYVPRPDYCVPHPDYCALHPDRLCLLTSYPLTLLFSPLLVFAVSTAIQIPPVTIRAAAQLQCHYAVSFLINLSNSTNPCKDAKSGSATSNFGVQPLSISFRKPSKAPSTSPICSRARATK